MTQGSPLANPMPWDLVSSAYAEEVVPLFEPFAHEALRLVAPPAGSRIVDVACGPGTLSVLAAKAGLHVDAIDFSHSMVELASSRIARLGIDTIELRVADGQSLPFGNAMFDGAFSMFGLMFFPDRAKGLAELRRVLRPGAKALISSWYPLESIPALAAIFATIREVMSRALGAPPPPAQPSPLTTVDACRAEMAASFADVEVHAFSVTEHSASADSWWENMTRTMAPIVLTKKNLGDKWPMLDEAARKAIRGVVGDGPVSLELQAHLTVGTAR